MKITIYFNSVLTSEVLREISTHMDRPTAGSCPAKAFFASWVTSGISLMAKLNCRMKEMNTCLHFFEKLPNSTLWRPIYNILGQCPLKYLWNRKFPDWLRLFIFANISLAANSSVFLDSAVKNLFLFSHLRHTFTHRVSCVSPILIKPIAYTVLSCKLLTEENSSPHPQQILEMCPSQLAGAAERCHLSLL